MPKLLLPHEWLAVALMLLSLGGFACFSYNHYSESLPVACEAVLVEKETIEVIVEGAVKRPGVHVLPCNSLLGAVLSQAEPLPEADLKGFRKNQKVRDGQIVRIPERPLITVYLTGAVETPGAKQVRQGTTVASILQLCALHPQADTKSLRGKRLLVNEEHIHVPFKA